MFAMSEFLSPGALVGAEVVICGIGALLLIGWFQLLRSIRSIEAHLVQMSKKIQELGRTADRNLLISLRARSGRRRRLRRQLFPLLKPLLPISPSSLPRLTGLSGASQNSSVPA
jgi:hypothetical protein